MIVEEVSQNIDTPLIDDSDVQERIEYVCRCPTGAGVRVLLAALLAKVHDPTVDIRKPYTAISGEDSYSGRHYDEDYVGPFIHKYDLPCNPTTGFLTPALRTKNEILIPNMDLGGKPPRLYKDLLQLLTDVESGELKAEHALRETLRCLLIIKNERECELQSLLAGIKSQDDSPLLSSEGIMKLIQQHLKCPHSSRLSVLAVAAAYKAAEAKIGERVLPLAAHTAADSQTGTLGDLEITLVDDNQIVTSYEMKSRRVTRDDIDCAMQKIAEVALPIDNYIFITTENIELEVLEHATSMYHQYGIEVTVLACIGFLRHFLHLFHRLRSDFLEKYQELLLAEPQSAVRHELKQAFLALRRAAETGG